MKKIVFLIKKKDFYYSIILLKFFYLNVQIETTWFFYMFFFLHEQDWNFWTWCADWSRKTTSKISRSAKILVTILCNYVDTTYLTSRPELEHTMECGSVKPMRKTKENSCGNPLNNGCLTPTGILESQTMTMAENTAPICGRMQVNGTTLGASRTFHKTTSANLYFLVNLCWSGPFIRN